MIDLWLMHWPGPGRHLDYPPVKMGMDKGGDRHKQGEDGAHGLEP